MLLFNEFFNESKHEKDVLLFYAFDWDDNILSMPTVIHMDKLVDEEWVPVDVSTSEFATVRNNTNYRLYNNNPDKAFSEFRDVGARGSQAFLEDLKKAISLKRYGPAWDDFIECLVNGSIFAIITARGHEPIPMRRGIEWIIDNLLSHEQLYEMYNNLLKFEYLFGNLTNSDSREKVLRGKPSENIAIASYLDQCEFIGVSSPSRGGTPNNPEKSKEEALLLFKDKINKYAKSIGVIAKIGFSDDDIKNVKHIEDLIDGLNNERFPHIKQMSVKNTKDPSNVTKRVKIFEGNISVANTPGMQSSVVPFSKFNNMRDKLTTDPNEGSNKSLRLGANHLSDISNKIKGKVKKKQVKRKLSSLSDEDNTSFNKLKKKILKRRKRKQENKS